MSKSSMQLTPVYIHQGITVIGKINFLQFSHKDYLPKIEKYNGQKLFGKIKNKNNIYLPFN